MNNSGALLLSGAYTVAAMASVFAWARERDAPMYRRCAVLLLVLGLVLWGIALQHASGAFSPLTDMARAQSRAEGWYDDRRDLQAAAVRAVPLAGIAAAAGVLWWVRKAWKRYLPVLLTLTFLVCFAGIQAVSLHQIDALLRTQYAGLSLQRWLDLFGLLPAGVSLVPFLRREPLVNGRRAHG